MYTALESQCVAELKAVRHQIVMARQRGQCRDREWTETIDKITSLVDGAADLARESEINEREMWGRAGGRITDRGKPAVVNEPTTGNRLLHGSASPGSYAAFWSGLEVGRCESFATECRKCSASSSMPMNLRPSRAAARPVEARPMNGSSTH